MTETATAKVATRRMRGLGWLILICSYVLVGIWMKRGTQPPLPASPHGGTGRPTCEYYWTFQLGGNNYGIMQLSPLQNGTVVYERRSTFIIWKNLKHPIPVTAPLAVGIVGFVVILLVSLLFWSLWSGFHHWSGVFSREEHQSKSPG